MRKGSTMSAESREKIRRHNLRSGKVPPSRKGVRLTDEHKRKIAEGVKASGHVPPSAQGRVRSDEFKEKVSRNNARYWKGKVGVDHPGWKGGIEDANGRVRRSGAYKQWRSAVFERDDYTCQNCHERGGRLNADHIKPFALYPELRLDIDNGRTLCELCHREIGWRGSHVA